MQINRQRLLNDIEKYSLYGRDERGGITRPAFSEPDMQVRELFIKELKDLGLKVSVDPIANIWGKRKGKGEMNGTIVIGSHLDTVPNGGKYDGALGVLIAKEVVVTLIENKIELQHDLEIVSFTAEESNDFGFSTLGSKTFAGKLTEEELIHASDSQGTLLKDAVRYAGGDLYKLDEMVKDRREKKAYVEIHIEQGKRLESNHLSVGIVEDMVGVYRTRVKVKGEANHSGTTMMAHRSDALAAASEMVLAVEKICCADETDLVGTVGQLSVEPNAVNVVPGEVNFVAEIRSEDEARMDHVINLIEENWKRILNARGVTMEQNLMVKQKPIPMDEDIVTIFRETADELSEPYTVFPSMAVHDAAHMASLSKACMIFVKSINGRSHCPEEYSKPEDIEKAANILLNGVINIDKVLSKEARPIID
ncbi:Zn-dependent hydrolase [Bacillus norwichensis]|uniref:Zn-dependent hydrolase n=1 Tax=Bacillus norwichensis TaxID=2762217 RepID=A0ABR8VR15_9BACI|nr:Zn-dependent hydrolase [Bacillus norwichensis]MBD8007200.1 Zn-dependent hydrolase [Bacillus norwichensis]